MSQNTHPHSPPEPEAVATRSQAAPSAAPPPAPPVPPRPSVLSWLLGFIPSVLILGLLTAVGVWGFTNDWNLPKFATLFGTEDKKDEGKDWCEEHSVPESSCVQCKPDLLKLPKHGWCQAHGVHDCPFEHPDVVQLAQPPRITAADLRRARAALDFTDRPENGKDCKLHPRVVQLASAEAVERAGIKTEEAKLAPMVEGVTAAGEIGYEHLSIARVSSRLAGMAWRVLKKIGDPVQRGEIVALIDAAEVGKAKTEYLQAIALLDMRTTLVARLKRAEGSVSETKQLEAQTDMQTAQLRLLSAEQRLTNLGFPVPTDTLRGLAPAEVARRIQFLGLPDSLARTLDPLTTTGNLLPLTSPLDGVVVSCEFVAGEAVEPAKVLQVVADTRVMLLTLNIPQEEAPRVKLGDKVVFQPDGAKQLETAALCWLSTAVDPKTRTVQVRSELDNKDGRLRAGMYGSGRVILREEPKAVVVPNEALHWDGECHIVFVRDKHYEDKGAPKVFHARCVRIGAKDDRKTEILVGVLPGEVVATHNSVILRGELLKGSLGGGD